MKTVFIPASAVEYLVSDHVRDIYGKPVSIRPIHETPRIRGFNKFTGYEVELEAQTKESPNEIG